VIDPDGTVRRRTRISEQRVLYDTVGMRDGQTIATRVGAWPMIVAALGCLGAAQVLARRSRPVTATPEV
jgi:apolipoprotein N-acyltransferase